MLCGNDQRLRYGFNFRLPTVWDAPSSVYEISMLATQPEFIFTTIVVQDYVKSLENNGELLDKLAWETTNSAEPVSYITWKTRLDKILFGALLTWAYTEMIV